MNQNDRQSVSQEVEVHDEVPVQQQNQEGPINKVQSHIVPLELQPDLDEVLIESQIQIQKQSAAQQLRNTPTISIVYIYLQQIMSKHQDELRLQEYKFLKQIQDLQKYSSEKLLLFEKKLFQQQQLNHTLTQEIDNLYQLFCQKFQQWSDIQIDQSNDNLYIQFQTSINGLSISLQQLKAQLSELIVQSQPLSGQQICKRLETIIQHYKNISIIDSDTQSSDQLYNKQKGNGQLFVYINNQSATAECLKFNLASNQLTIKSRNSQVLSVHSENIEIYTRGVWFELIETITEQYSGLLELQNSRLLYLYKSYTSVQDMKCCKPMQESINDLITKLKNNFTYGQFLNLRSNYFYLIQQITELCSANHQRFLKQIRQQRSRNVQ